MKSKGNAGLFLNFTCGRREQTKQTQIYYRIVHFSYFKCFRLVLKSKGNAGLFSNFVWRTDMRGERSGGQGQPSQTEIYYRIVHFYGFKYFVLLLKGKGNAHIFSNFLWWTDGRGAGGRRGQTCQTEIFYRIAYFYCFKCFGLVLKSHCDPQLVFC